MDQWNSERAGCSKAFDKWKDDCDDLLSGVFDECPACCIPLLPVVKRKHKWRYRRDGTPYKVRLCLDLKNGGYNDNLLEWPFHYRGLDSVAEKVRLGSG